MKLNAKHRACCITKVHQMEPVQERHVRKNISHAALGILSIISMHLFLEHIISFISIMIIDIDSHIDFPAIHVYVNLIECVVEYALCSVSVPKWKCVGEWEVNKYTYSRINP